MGENDLGDAARIDPACGKIFGKPAVGGLVFCTRPNIDNDDIIPGPDQRDIRGDVDQVGMRS
jgi:hypothetical protein